MDYQLIQALVTRKYLPLPPAATATARGSRPPGPGRLARLPQTAGDKPGGQAALEIIGGQNQFRKAHRAAAVRAEIGDNGTVLGILAGRRHLPPLSPLTKRWHRG